MKTVKNVIQQVKAATLKANEFAVDMSREVAIRKWAFVQDVRGGGLFENKVMLVGALVLIFIVGGLAIKFGRQYWTDTVEGGINSNGGMNANFGEGVN